MIELFTAATPNGWKASITLEELGLPYEVRAIDLGSGNQRKPEYLEVNPNGRIPAIIDHDLGGMRVFESGAIMIHLCEKTGSDLLPSDPARRAEVLSWLMFQMGGVGPMMGQANVFFRYFPEKIQPAIDRYQNESRRLFEVLDGQLQKTEWLAGDYSIADIANWSWVRIHGWSGVSTEGLDALVAWMEAVQARPAVQRGIEVPSIDRDVDETEGEVAEKLKKAGTSMIQR